MAIRLEDLDNDEIPRFVPRKKRKNSESVYEELQLSIVPDQVRVDPANEAGMVSTAPQLPAWRLAKENEAPKESSQAVDLPKKWFHKHRKEMTRRDWRIMCADLEIHATVFTHGKPTPFAIEPLLSWSELTPGALLKYLDSRFPQPTPVQRCAVKLVLNKEDTVIKAPTGSGKTLGFLIPLFELQPAKALILAPTRELAVQTGEVASDLVANMPGLAGNWQPAVLVGGHDLADQEQQLAAGPRIIIATPGRLLDFLGTKQANLNDCDYLVFDEADRMIDLGFEPQISEIMRNMGTSVPIKPRQTLMFSATWPPSVQRLSTQFFRPRFSFVSIGKPAQTISQSAVMVADNRAKFAQLLSLMVGHRTAIVFVRTKAAAESLSQRLNSEGNSKRKSLALHGNLSQESRTAAVSALREGRIAILVATDVAARGVDIPGVSLVVNYDMPGSIETYVHRIGRTGRAGDKGKAVSLVTTEDSGLFPDLRRILRQSGGVPPF